MIRPFFNSEQAIPWLFYAVPDSAPAGYPTVFTDRFYDEREHWESLTIGVVYGTTKPYFGPLPPYELGNIVGAREQWAEGLDYNVWLAGGYQDPIGCWPVETPDSPSRIRQIEDFFTLRAPILRFQEIENFIADPIPNATIAQIENFIADPIPNATIAQIENFGGVVGIFGGIANGDTLFNSPLWGPEFFPGQLVQGPGIQPGTTVVGENFGRIEITLGATMTTTGIYYFSPLFL